MATVSAVLAYRAQRDVPVPRAEANASEVLTTPGTSTIEASRGEYWVLTVTGGNVWVKFGASPTAGSGDEWLVLDGTTREFEADRGQKVSVVDA